MARRPGTRGLTFFVLGNVIFSIIGIVIGYFLLVQIRPDMNFLGLNIPMVEEMEIPEVPEGWPKYDWDPTKPYVPAAVTPLDDAGGAAEDDSEAADDAAIADEPAA